MRVSQLLTAVLGVVDCELWVLGNTANGDVLQALAMALAARTAMLHAPYAVEWQLAADLATTALARPASVTTAGRATPEQRSPHYSALFRQLIAPIHA
jgi:hypothetical protein